MASSNDLAASLARLEEWARHSESLALKAEKDRSEMMVQLQQLTITQTQLINDMNDVKPVTDMVTSLRAKLAGAFLVCGVIGAVVWAGVQFFREEILKYLAGT